MTPAASSAVNGTRGGTGKGPKVPPIETNFCTQGGAPPVGNPRVQSWTAPCSAVPVPSVTISGWIASDADRAPFRAPTAMAARITPGRTTANGTP